MKRGIFKTAVILAVAMAFLLVSVLAFAAETAKAKQWVVIKDVKGKCKVLETAKAKTDKTIAGPFVTKDEAQKAKEKECPKPAKK